MSVLLSMLLCVLFSSCYVGYNTLQVSSFGDGREGGMVFGLAANFNQAQATTGVEGSRGQHLQEVGCADVVGAGASYKDAAGAKHLQGAQVELFIAPKSGVEVALGFGESRRVENDGVVAAVGGGVVVEQVEGVGFDPLDFRIIPVPWRQIAAIERGVLVGDFERGAGTIDGGDAAAARGEVESKTSLIAEDVEGVAVGIGGRCGVVLALVEEGSGLLAGEGVVVELDAVHGDDVRMLVTLEWS